MRSNVSLIRNPESFTLEQIVELGMNQHVEKLGEISASTCQELAIELV